MTTVELRLGNLIYDDVERICRVSAISENSIEAIPDDNRTKWTTVFRPKPVPISETLLRELGFSDKDYKSGYIGIDVNHTDFVLTKPSASTGIDALYRFELKYGGWERVVIFKFAHELQNFFFALYNKELTRK